MITTFLRVVRKVYFYRGHSEIFLAKENENVDFCRAVIGRLKDSRVLLICRDPQPMLDSYLTMSLTCTKVKHGVDPENRPGWRDINTQFRREQCRKFVDFWRDIEQLKSETAILVSFNDFNYDVLGTMRRIYSQFELKLNSEFLTYLEDIQRKQSQRNKGYTNISCREPGFEFYSQFVQRAGKIYQ